MNTTDTDMTPPPTPGPLTTWASAWKDLIDRATNPRQVFTAPPPGGEPQERLTALLAIRDTLGADENAPDPRRHGVERLARKLAGDHPRYALEELLATAAAAIEGEIVKAMKDGASHPDLILTDDFAGPALRLFEDHRGNFAIGRALFYCGNVSALPADHHLHSVPLDDLFKYGDGSRVVVLGPPAPGHPLDNTPRPRAFYSTAAALRWTQIFRQTQKQQEEETARLDRIAAREQAERDRLREAEPTKLLERIRQIEDALTTPASTTPATKEQK
jgi:hypothetical protein